MMLTKMATIMFSIKYSARREIKVVKLPGPANKGNTSGKMDAISGLFSPSLNRVTPRIISKAMKKIINVISISLILFIGIVSCKKNKTTNPDNAKMAGFWTYKEDPAIDYWNANVLFKEDGTFRMYQALSLADTAAAQAIADTSNQVVTFGTYSVNGLNVKMTYQEFNIIDFKFTGTLNSSSNILIGNLDSNQPGSASPLWYLTKP